ncbi:hypothetical protein C8R44DRAFT_626754, partial [Mycena epipterygia]
MLAESDLTLCLPPCTPTFYSDAHKSWSTLDLVFATPRLADTVTKCVVSGGFGSDHRCVDVTINITLGRTEPPPRYRWRDADWDAFSKAVADACETDRKSAFSKRWFTADLKKMLRELNTLKNRAAKKNSSQAERDAVKPARNAYHSALRAQKRRHWKEWLED